MIVVLIAGLCACILFAAFIGLGTWQIHRLIWKHDLIARVAQRVKAPATDLPSPDRWPGISAESDEYRHVQVSGEFLPQYSTRVSASTIFGRGFWLMTPLRTGDGHIIWINRGFIDFSARPVTPSPSDATVTIDGLLRLNEPGGAVFRPNHPERHEWTSRDVVAMTAQSGLRAAAPFFIDAAATPLPKGCAAGQCSNYPVGGLTVTSFYDNHLVYIITWYALALMVAIGAGIAVKSEIRRRKSVH
jgi:surfeit locus 1 family protein